MRYRDFGNTGKKVSVLSFGVAKLPMIGEGKDERVNDELAIPIIQRAYEGGINYYDSAWNYLNEDSQRILGKALNHVRDKVYYATKLPCWLIKERHDFWKYLMDSLEKMDTDYIDFYHLHDIDKETFSKIKEWKMLDSIERALSKNYIHHLSFSFHGDPEFMQELVDTGLFSSLLCQYNLIDRRYEKAMAYAVDKGVGVAAMGPTGGGMIARGGTDFVKRMGSTASSSAEMAFRFVWGNKSVATALSGMDSIEQIEENLQYVEKCEEITQSELDRLDVEAEELKKFSDLYCSCCDYCRDCPQGIKIGTVFRTYLNHKVWGLSEEAKKTYAGLGEGSWNGKNPDVCNDCGACVKRCPQNLDIPSELKRVSAVLKNL